MRTVCFSNRRSPKREPVKNLSFDRDRPALAQRATPDRSSNDPDTSLVDSDLHDNGGKKNKKKGGGGGGGGAGIRRSRRNRRGLQKPLLDGAGGSSAGSRS